MTDDVVQVALKLLDKPVREGLTARSADCQPDGSKTSHVLVGLGSSAERNGKDLRSMKIKQQIMQLRRIVEEWDTLPLSEAEFNLFGRLSEALTAYDHEVRSGHPASERLCLKCGAPVSQCCC